MQDDHCAFLALLERGMRGALGSCARSHPAGADSGGQRRGAAASGREAPSSDFKCRSREAVSTSIHRRAGDSVSPLASYERRGGIRSWRASRARRHGRIRLAGSRGGCTPISSFRFQRYQLQHLGHEGYVDPTHVVMPSSTDGNRWHPMAPEDTIRRGSGARAPAVQEQRLRRCRLCSSNLALWGSEHDRGAIAQPLSL